MILPDVNVLVYAFRRDDPRHPLCRAWLNNVVMADAKFGISRLVLSAVVRITTNTRTYKTASTLADAFGFCDDLLNQPHCEAVEPGDGHWSVFQSLCLDTNTRGPKATDAWLAALAIEHGCEWITLDRDFARFPGLKWSVPTA